MALRPFVEFDLGAITASGSWAQPRRFGRNRFPIYDRRAQLLWTWLMELSHSPDAQARIVAYEAAFFTRPGKEAFLSWAMRGLREPDKSIGSLAAKWMAERFSKGLNLPGG